MSTPAWISSLPAGVVRTDLLQDAAGGGLTYADALQLLTDVETAGAVTASEFAALQTVAANLNDGLGASAYVASIFSQLVDGSPANATWTGGAAGSTTPLGNLAAGTTAAQLGELIGQWFLGTNLPDPTPPDSSAAYPYSVVAGPLYGPSGAAAANDVCQGQTGDCEVMADLIDVVENHPQQLASMIVANPNGTYGVRFYLNGNEVWETVNDQLPTYPGTNELLFAHNPNELNTALWVALVEKAYAQLSATGEIGHPAIDSYANINANAAATVLPALIDAGQVNYFFGSDADFYSDKAWYVDAIDSGDDVVVETGGGASDTYDSSGNIELVGDHAFAVVGYDSATGDFIIRNPWGADSPTQDWDTQFEVSLSAIAGVQGDIAIDNTGGDTSEIRLGSESGQILANSSTPIAGFVAISDTLGAAATRYNLQLLGGGRVHLNGAANLATAAQTALGQIVVLASQLSKVTISAAAGAGQQNLLVSASDGKVWSATADIQLAVSPAASAVNPVLGALVAAGGAIAVSSLFTVSGAPGVWYSFIVPDGDGEINLNGAQNVWASGDAGSETYQVTASQLSLLTYTPPPTGGPVTLQVSDYANGAWSDWQNVQVNVGVTVAAALLDDADGQLAAGANVADSAANIFANLNAMQSAFQSGELTSIRAIGTTLLRESLSQSQYTADLGLISILRGDVALTVGDEQILLNGATVSGATVASGHAQIVEDGAVALATRVSSGGAQIVSSGGVASATTVSGGGFEYVLAAGIAAGTVVSEGGAQGVQSGGVADATTVRSGGAENVWSAGEAIATNVLSGGTQTVRSGGLASATVVSDGGHEVISSGGVADATEVLSGGQAYIHSGGRAVGTTVSSGGSETVFSGGDSVGLDLSRGGVAIIDGEVRIAGARTLAGTLAGSGAIVQTAAADLVLSDAGAAFSGQAVISGGTIELAAAGAIGKGSVVFAATGSAVLQIDAADAPAAGGTFANVISNFSGADEDIDLRSIAFVSGASATVSDSTLVLTDGGKTYKFELSGSLAGAYPVLSDGHGGTLIDPEAIDPTVLAFAHNLAAFAPPDAATAALVSATSPSGQTPFLHPSAAATARHF